MKWSHPDSLMGPMWIGRKKTVKRDSKVSSPSNRKDGIVIEMEKAKKGRWRGRGSNQGKPTDNRRVPRPHLDESRSRRDGAH